MSPVTLPEFACGNESDVEQKLIYPLLAHPSFIALPAASIVSKKQLGRMPFVDKAALPKNYIPDYVIFFDGLPACVIEGKGPDVEVEHAIREARLYAQVLNQNFPSGINPLSVCAGCNGKLIAIGAFDTNEFRTFPIDQLVIGGSLIEELKLLIGAERLQWSVGSARRSLSGSRFTRPSKYMNAQLFIEKIRQNALAPYLNQIYEMFFRAEDPEKIQLILDEAYVDTADLREYDNVLHVLLRQIENRTEQRLINTDRKREYTLSPEITRYSAESGQGRMHLIVGSRGSGKSLFIARFFLHLFPTSLRNTATWLIIDFNKASDDLINIEDYMYEMLVEHIQNLGFDQHSLENLEKVFSVELNRLKKGPLSAISDRSERERSISNELMKLTNDKRAFAKALARHITGDSGRPLIVAFDNVDRRRSEQQLTIFQAAQAFRTATRAFCLLTLRDVTFERYKKEPPLDTFAQINNFYIRPPRFSLVLQKRLKLALETGLNDVIEVEQTSSRGMRFVYSTEQLGIFLSNVYEALFSGEHQVGRIIDALAERDVRDALAMFSRILASGHFDADRVIQIGVGGRSKITHDQLLKILMRADYKLYSDRSGFISNIFWLPDDSSGNIFLGTELLGFFNQKDDAGKDQMTGYWRLEEVLADLSSMGFLESEIRSVVSFFIEKRMLAFDGEETEKASNTDLIKLTPSGFIHLRSLPQFIEYISSVCIHVLMRDDAVARRIAAVWNRTEAYSDLDFLRKHDVASMYVEYLAREKARLDADNPLFKFKAREANLRLGKRRAL